MCENNYVFLLTMSQNNNVFLLLRCLPLTRVFLFQFPILPFLQFLTITDNKDVHNYWFYREQVSQQKELPQMVEHSLRMREVLGAIPRFPNLYRACNSFLPKEEYVEIDRIL